VKLSPKPSPKVKKPSRGNTSTPHAEQASSSTTTLRSKTRSTGITILTNVPYTGVDQHGQAVPTAHQMAEEKQKNTSLSTAIYTERTLNDPDKIELFQLGVVISRMPWVKVYCDIPAFIQGYARGEGVRKELGSRSSAGFDRRIIIGGSPDEANDTTIVVGTLAQLTTFVGGLYGILYKRGIIV
jgi:hypothetical protein